MGCGFSKAEDAQRRRASSLAWVDVSVAGSIGQVSRPPRRSTLKLNTADEVFAAADTDKDTSRIARTFSTR